MGIISGHAGGATVALSTSGSHPIQVNVGGINSVQSGLNAQASGITMLAKSYTDLAKGMSDIAKTFNQIGDMTVDAQKQTDANSSATDAALKHVADLKAQNVKDDNPDMVAAKSAAQEAYAKENRSRFFMFDWFGEEDKTRRKAYEEGMK